jgi:hypothetical protein
VDLLKFYNFALCDVISVEDPCEGNRIKVSIPGVDNNELDKLPFCFPLLPKHLLIRPKVGEKVLVLFQKDNTRHSLMFYIGPIVMQDYMLDFAPGKVTNAGRAVISTDRISRPELDEKGSKNKLMGPEEAPSRNPDNIGAIPKPQKNSDSDYPDVILRGRGNSDIVLKDDEVQIRCGFKKNPHDVKLKERLKFNPVDLGYIQMKYKPEKDGKGQEIKSSINIVADRINLISHDSTSPALGASDLGDPEKLISDEAMEKIYQKAHPLPYGDDLVEFLKEFVRVFNEHSHPYHMMPPRLSSANVSAISGNLDNMLSKTIRIN